MANRFVRSDYGKWDVWYRPKWTLEELQERRAALAKAANSRLRRLESANTLTGNKISEMPWFDVVYDNLEVQGRKRFAEQKKVSGMSLTRLKNEITLLQDFLSMKSSTVGGYRRIEEERVEEFIKKGVPEELASSPDFYHFLVSETYENVVESSLSSEDIVDFIHRGVDMGLNFKQIVEAFEEHEKDKGAGWKEMNERLKTRSVK